MAHGLRSEVYLSGMAEDARVNDEQNTLKRSHILRIQYLDTSAIQDKALYKDLMPLEELYALRLIPILA